MFPLRFCNQVKMAFFLTYLLSAETQASVGRLDPCTTPGPLSKGAEFHLGLAFWPGGSIEDWGPAIDVDTVDPGLSPCLLTPYKRTNTSDNSTSHQEYLIEQGVVFATYDVEVDRMSVLRGNITEQSLLFDQTDNPSINANATSIVAFRGAYRSPARYFQSSSSRLTSGKGVVQELALIARADSGKLESLQWDDVSCNKCGGKDTTRCLSARSSDDVQYSCTVSPNCTDSSNSKTFSDPCSPAVYFGFAGSDKHHRTFLSGYQIRNINQFSITDFYQQTTGRLKEIYDMLSLGGKGEAPEGESESGPG